VLAGESLAHIRGRPVLVGFGPTEIGDRLSTPLTTEFPAPGVEIHAQILDSIMTARKIRETPLWFATGLLFLTCWFVVAIFRKWRGRPAFGLFLLAGIGVYAGAFLTFLWRSQILPAGSMMIAVVVGPLLVYTADFVIVERSVTEQLLGLRSWLAIRKNGSTGESTELSWKLQLLQDLQTQLGSRYELHRVLLESTQDLVAIFDEQGNLLLHNQPFAVACHLQNEAGFTLEQLRARLLPVEDPSVEGETYLDKELYAIRIVPLPPTALAPGGGTIVTMANLRTRVERDRARAEALGFITHELRTPLVSIQGFAELMMHYPSSPSSAAAPETIFRESRRLLALINSYLDVLRLDAGAQPIHADLVDIGSVIGQVFDVLQPLAAAANMRLIFDNGEPIAIMGDTTLLSGAVLNLVSNAIKYGRADTEVVVSCAYSGHDVILRVSNVGDPIAAEDITRLFDAYYRASNQEESKTGWGLGLAFVKRIAEKHGGSVRAESLPTGNCFEVRLPFRAGVAASVNEVV
jgi:signal transduction histidine kinase